MNQTFRKEIFPANLLELLRNMAENIEKRHIKLNITKEQFWAIYHFFNYNDWDLQNAIVQSEWDFNEDQNVRPAPAAQASTTTSVSDNDDDADDDNNDEGPNFMNNHLQDNFQDNGHGDRDGDNNGDNNQQPENMCQHCYLSPCITTYHQSWLGHGAVPHARNAPLRKKKYKLFWKVISEHGGWLRPMYREKKQRLLNRTMDDSIVWTPREIMPDCVLHLVRGLYPNPPGQAYMGHKWW